MPLGDTQATFDGGGARLDAEGVNRILAARTVAVALLVTACSTANQPAKALVITHASKDLACPSRQLKVQSLWGDRYRVTGCGRTTTYQSACNLLDCAVSEQGEQPAPWRGRPDPGPSFGDR